MLSSHQQGLLAAFGSPIVEGASAEENFERLVKWKGWKSNSTSFRAVSKAYFGTASQRRHADDSEDGSQSDDGVIVTPGTSDDGIKLVSSDDDEGGLDGALARLELSDRRPKDRVRNSIDSYDQIEHDHDAHDASAGEDARYFDRFPSFEPDNSIPIKEEFRRLAKTMRWVEDGEHFLTEQRKAYASELQYFIYARSGPNATALDRVQAFCEDLRITPPPPSMNQCKKVLSDKFVNIFDYIDCRRKGTPVQPVFTTKSCFRKYTKGQKIFPKLAVKDDRTLGFLLCKLFDYSQPRG